MQFYPRASIIQQAQWEMWELDKAANALDRAIEFLPKSSLKTEMIILRAKGRNVIENKIKPLWEKLLATIRGKDNQVGVSGEPTGLINPLADVLAQKLLNETAKAIIFEKELLYHIAIMKDVKPNTGHPMSGLLDWFSSNEKPEGFTFTEAQTIPVGKTALEKFHDYSSVFPTYTYTNIDELATHYTKDPNILYDGIGLAILSSRDFLTDEKVNYVMQALAEKGQGQVPENMTTFFTKLGEIASNPSLVEAINFTATKTISDISTIATETFEEVGGGTLSALKTTTGLIKYLPWIALAGGALYIFTMAGGPMKLLKFKRT